MCLGQHQTYYQQAVLWHRWWRGGGCSSRPGEVAGTKRYRSNSDFKVFSCPGRSDFFFGSNVCFSPQNELNQMKAVLSSKGKIHHLVLSWCSILKHRRHSFIVLSERFVERDWRDKQKVVDGLRDTVDKQRRDLDSMRKDVSEKEMICSALKVCCLLLI